MPKLPVQMPPPQADMARIGQAIEEAAALYRQGKLDQAEKICTRLIKALPDLFDAHHLLGLVKLSGGKAGAALGHLERAVKINPGSPQALSNLAMTLADLNRHADALEIVEQALALAPGNVEALNNRGNVFLKLDRAAEALADFERAVAIDPGFLSPRLNRGNALAALGRHEEAVAQYDEVLAVEPTHADTQVSRANAFLSLGRYADAIEGFDAALAARPHDVKALTCRGMALHALNRNREALEDYAAALAIDKRHADAHHNAALSWLTLGDYRRGFEAYEWRWQRTGMPARRRSFGKPLWLGEYPLQRKTILLHAEQGLGDTIQFVRYAPLLARAGAKVMLEVPSELTALLARVAGVTSVVARGAALPAFDVHSPLASLPHALRTEVSSIPADVPYLVPSPERIAKWRARIETLPPPRIAIAWAGSAGHANDRNRSIPLAQLEPLLARAGASFVSIQRELCNEDAATLARLPRVTHAGAELDDFEDTAAVVSLVDLVISVDTSVVHLAGALARPVWILVPYCPDWRWMLEREDSPWYPTARLYRQTVPGDWASVLARLEEDLSRNGAPMAHPPV